MEKRLPLALLLSVLVMVGWWFFFAPKPGARAPRPAQQSGVPAPATAAIKQISTEPSPVTNTPVLGELRVESSERTLELRVGTPGQAGSYFARFTNLGARLLELRLGDSFDQPNLETEKRLDIAHWTTLLDSVGQGDRKTGSFGWRASGAATASERGIPLDRALWTMALIGPAEAPTGVEFAIQPGAGVLFKKRISFQPGSYDLKVELSMTNEAALPGPASFLFTPAEVVPLESGDSFYVEPQAVAAGREEGQAELREKPKLAVKVRDDRGSELSGAFALPPGPMSFAGEHNKYFAVLARGEASGAPTLRGATWRLIRDEAFVALHPESASKAWRFLATDILLQLDVPAAGQTGSWSYSVYAGPKDPAALVESHPDYKALLEHDLGFFMTIAHFLLAVLNFFHGIFGNWGVAIILLTLSVRTVLFPLNRRSQTAMARYQSKMKRVQPQIEALKKRYEKDPAKLRQEQTLLMQKEGAFPPLGGCLPMFLQIPVFFGLFSALRASFDLRQAPFAGWIVDLAKPDQLWEMNLAVPWIGTIHYFNLLPILMVVLWVLQQQVMPKPTEEQALKMQRMMTIMPVFMGFFLYNYAAGLSLYMITQSTLGIVEQVVIKRFWPLDTTEQPKKTGGFWSKIAKLQEEQARKLNAPANAKAKRR